MRKEILAHFLIFNPFVETNFIFSKDNAMGGIELGHCEIFSRFPAPQSIYETIFKPTIVVPIGGRSSYFDSAIFKMVSSFSSYDEVQKYACKEYNQASFQSMLSLADESYRLLSNADWAIVMIGRSIVYRSCQLVVLAIQHKIALTNWRPATKFAISSVISLTPSVALSLLGGGVSRDVLIMGACRVIVPTLFLSISRKMGNRAKEVDEISISQHFSLKGFIIQNLLTMTINLSTTPLLQFWYSVIHDKTIFYTHPVKFELCSYFDELKKVHYYVSGHGVVQTQITCVLREIGWMVGKIAVDALFIGLAWIGVVKDLRAPIYSIFRRPHKCSKQPVISPLKVVHKRAARQTTVAPLPSSSLSRPSREADEEPFLFLPEGTSTQYKRPVPHIKKKTKGKPSVSSIINDPETVAPVKSEIELPGCVRNLRKLEGPGLGEVRNVWGMISYGNLTLVDEKLKFYVRSLKTGHVGGHTASIKKAGNGGKTGKQFYKIRPGSQGDRMLGRLIQGEAAIYERLKEIFPYQVAWDLICQMKDNSTDEKINFIDFYHLVKHKNVKKELEKM